jgi:hypothetical protein
MHTGVAGLRRRCITIACDLVRIQHKVRRQLGRRIGRIDLRGTGQKGAMNGQREHVA